jgi:hypothetical protein
MACNEPFEQFMGSFEGRNICGSFYRSCVQVTFFAGIGVIGFAVHTGNVLFICGSLVAYVLNLALLSYARKQPY